jgi:drug/metabolite transporter (DMT)-like permease
VTQLTFGISAGLVAALCSSLSYLISRHHGTRRPGGSRRLLLLAHVVMGLVCVPAVFLLLPSPAVASKLTTATVWQACLVSTGSYFIGTACVFHALSRADASRLSPLLGLKIVTLALIVSLVLGQRLDARQWLAVTLSGTAAVMLQRGGSGISARSFALVVFSCVCFSIADLGIIALIDALQAAFLVDRLRAGSLAMALTYVVGACLAAPLAAAEYGRRQPPTAGDWLAAIHYSAAWLTAMVALYACLGTVGVVFGTILQSTRGVMSVVLGATLAHLGWHELESQVDRILFCKRLIAAILMTAAIAVYVLDLA